MDKRFNGAALPVGINWALLVTLEISDLQK